MKTIELYKIIHDNGEWANGVQNGDTLQDNITAETVESMKSQFRYLGIMDRFRVESKGLFKVRKVTYHCNSMSQSAIDDGGDNDPFEIVESVYTPLLTNNQ